MSPRDLDCIELVELVTDYLEGRLPAEEVEAIDAHLAVCPGCEHYVAQMRTVMRISAAERDDAELQRLAEKLLPAFRTYRRGLT